MAVGERIRDAGGELYIVGGWVRDVVINGVAPSDIDFATDLLPDQVEAAMHGLGTVYTMGKKHGTIGVRVGGITAEITTYRDDTYDGLGHEPKEITFVKDLNGDLLRRDFTINSMAVSLVPEPAGVLIDPFGGMRDIRKKLIRTPRHPEKSMWEDPLRMMRAVRFAAWLDFELEEALRRVIREQADRLELISWERRREELEKILVSPNPGMGIKNLIDLGLMAHVIPEVCDMAGVLQPKKFHRGDVLVHTLVALTNTPPDPLLRRAVLFHDIGKPATFERDSDGKISFINHPQVGARITRRAMQRLKYSNYDIDATCFLVRQHMRPFDYQRDWGDKPVIRFIRDCQLEKGGKALVPLEAVFEIAVADMLGGNADETDLIRTRVVALKQRVDEILCREPVLQPKSPIDGNEIMGEFGLEPGPMVGRVKDYLVNLVGEGELAQDDREKALQLARDFLDEQAGAQ